MRFDKLKEIARKYLDGTATQEEEQWLHEYYNNINSEETETVITEKSITEAEFGKEMFVELKRKIANQQPVHLTKLHRRLLPRIAIAASILLLLGIAAVLSLQTKHAEKPPVAQTTEVPPPDKTKAVIALADGTTISIDSLTTLEQNGVTVVKDAQGKIIYSGSSPSPSGEGRGEAAYNTLTNPRGSKVIDITLADGSRVWLNAGSSITYPVAFTGNERKVTMTGEGYFEVAKVSSPNGGVREGAKFIVEANGTITEVLGTHFNINAYDDEAETKITLLEGSVNVSRTSVDRGQSSVVRLKPGEQAVASSHSPLTIHHSPDLEQVMAWKNGRFQFTSADLQTILRQAARWYDVEVEYKGNINERFSGAIPRNVNASQLFKILESTDKLSIKIEGRKIIVQPR